MCRRRTLMFCWCDFLRVALVLLRAVLKCFDVVAVCAGMMVGCGDMFGCPPFVG